MSASPLHGRRLVLGVCGSIAAYKAVSLLRRLMADGAEVRVVMTTAATKFVTPLTFETLSRYQVATDLFAPHEEMVHLTWAEWADAVVLAPCTANRLAQAALGLGDDLLNTMLLAASRPVLFCPAMDGGMWDHPAVQQHVATLRARGHRVLDPEVGPLASGRSARGRLPSDDIICQAIHELLGGTGQDSTKDLAGQRILISAGPTREPIDPVRFLSNHSSGKMGYALAEVAQARGASVRLVTGPTALTPPAGVETIPITTAQELHHTLAAHFEWATMLVMAAAVADYRPAQVADRKLKKSQQPLTQIALEPTVDVLSSLSRMRTGQCMVGFAAETENLIPHATSKLKSKGLDLIVANNVLAPGAGFGSDSNRVTLIDRTGLVTELPLMSKREVAHHILDAAVSVAPRTTPRS
ncbi:MAG: bifunctional phosphopantothenoylcysteine decarboxylase/phosphopantothenate--cysteine ligase CoaBC [Nitrospiraceae bacterium]